MMIARRLRPLGWAAAVGVAAISFYLVSLRVAAERGALEQVERQIVETHGAIRQLKTELNTRASMRQLERWNGEVLALSAPTASQFLDRTQMARVDTLQGVPGGVLNIPQTVQVAMVEPAAPAADPATLGGIVATAEASAPERIAARAPAGDVDSKRRERVAMIERKLRSDPALSGTEGRPARELAMAGAPKVDRAARPAVKDDDRKPAEKKPADSKTADRKPAEKKPADTKAADRKPAGKKPVDTKAADRKPAEKKPADSRTAGKKVEDKKAR